MREVRFDTPLGMYDYWERSVEREGKTFDLPGVLARES